GPSPSSRGAPPPHPWEADPGLRGFGPPVMVAPAAGGGDAGAAAATVPVSPTLPATAEGTSHRPRRRIAPTARALAITDLPTSGISGANLPRGRLAPRRAPDQDGFTSPDS